MATMGLWPIAAAAPDKPAVIEPDGSNTSYSELAAAANRYSHGLRALGLQPGDSIVLLLPNNSEFLAIYFGALQIGLYVVPVNWHLVAAEVTHILTDCDAKVFIAHERFTETAQQAAAQRPGIKCFAAGEISGWTRLSEMPAATGRPEHRTLGAPMVYTSGTSGRPKGVRRPLTGADPDQVPPTALWFFGLFGLGLRDEQPSSGHVHLCGSPLYHAAVLNFVVISLQLGHPVVLMDHWDPQETLRLIEAHQVTHTHMVPTQFRRMLALADEVRGRYDLSSMRAAIHGAAPCPREVKQRMLDWWGPVVIEYYAASEGGGALITAPEWLERPGSVGKPWPGSEIRVLDDSGSDLPTGEPGQVYLRMGDATFEYHQDPEKTRQARLGKMFTVGDIGYLDADGYLYLCDRSSDMIISGGVNIYPAEIESELVCHPKVADVAVFGVPHDDWGEEIKAVVQPAEGVTPGPELTAELMAYAVARLAKFKLPRSIDYLDQLPRDPNGKLFKRKLRDPYWAGRDRAI